MKKTYITFLAFLCCFVLGNNWLQAQELVPILSQARLHKDNSTSGFDGPYIFYTDKGIVVKQVGEKKGVVAPSIQTFTKDIKGKKIMAQLSEKESFSFKIKKELKNETAVYNMPEKLIAISDIEGEFEAFKQFLIANGVMNAKYQWKYGKGHLVTVGDFFDRGLWVTQTLWLIYHLEQQAEKAGGKVHFILGNHDLMNMNNDFRYVRKKYFQNASLLQDDYLHFYKPNTELGRWLATKNIVEKIGNYVFVHAGISIEIANLGLTVQELNNKARDYCFDNLKARKCKDSLYSILYQFGISPTWYRGWGKQTIDITEAETILERWQVGKFVIGHTLHSEVTYLMNKRVIDLDVAHTKGVVQGLLIENGNEYKVDNQGNKTAIIENASIPEDDD
ncbi:metallophosphoesterase [Capnocytophaga sputigena]|uniref:metallophosphoesterase n=1 Tax=Capnocytophaga sputigena TaxID=1019 RepID=UPI0028EEB756|nr:metallophosphoesterase [Capnocytophaga sputigena]